MFKAAKSFPNINQSAQSACSTLDQISKIIPMLKCPILISHNSGVVVDFEIPFHSIFLIGRLRCKSCFGLDSVQLGEC